MSRTYERTQTTLVPRERPASPVPHADRAPHPAPEVRARPATPEEIGKGPRDVIRTATANGWIVDTPLYSRGTELTSSGGVAQRTERRYYIEEGTKKKRYNDVPVGPKVVDVLVVRMRRSAVRAAARWKDGGIDVAYIWTRELHPEEVSVTRLEELLKLDHTSLVLTLETTKEPAPE